MIVERLTALLTLLLYTTIAGEALAAPTNREDSSGILVWVFLAFCALIIIAQLFPAMMMLLGFRKGMKKTTAEVTDKVG